ncbi:hypothetical protein AAFC00_003358 [Neodothiora populina]|uniref:Fe2OG dioxygenase domain-containing protein n=1 Tax=Neodothiora populina TaxID=2781224 RepID=A0ABR3PAI6_9PEZI
MSTTQDNTLKTKFGTIQISQDEGAGDFDTIPIIDLTRMRSADIEDRKALALEIRDVCINVGFFYIKNHGVDSELIKEIHATAKEYFALPLEKKKANARANSSVFRGYTPVFEEFSQLDHSVGSLCESFDIGYELAGDPLAKPGDTLSMAQSDMYGENVWPDSEVIPTFKSSYLRYFRAMLTLSRDLLQIFALALDLPESFFDSVTTRPGCMSRIIHYPPQPIPDGNHPGIAPHTDFECFTILCQDDVRALQVLNQSNRWVTAEPIPDHFVVNIGDFMRFWTNGLFRSTMHKATNLTGRDRYSVPFFFGVNFDAMISVLDHGATQKSDAGVKPQSIMAGDVRLAYNTVSIYGDT